MPVLTSKGVCDTLSWGGWQSAEATRGARGRGVGENARSADGERWAGERPERAALRCALAAGKRISAKRTCGSPALGSAEVSDVL